MHESEKQINNADIQPSQWDTLSDTVFAGNIKPEPWVDFPDAMAEIDENELDIDGIPQTLWRGEKLYLDNIDQVGKRSLTTAGHERAANMDGKLLMARDKSFASTYAVGTDGVKYYDGPLEKEEIPIGVVYRINNKDNHLKADKTYDEPEWFGPFAGKIREFVTDKVEPTDYTVEEFYIMDDFQQANGHKRSDFRRPIEVYKVKNQQDLPAIVKKIKTRMDELDSQRSNRG